MNRSSLNSSVSKKEPATPRPTWNPPLSPTSNTSFSNSELGKGFLFEFRQHRFTFDEDHYFVDLVFYNRLLRLTADSPDLLAVIKQEGPGFIGQPRLF